MKILISPFLDPYFNLALEEVLFNQKDNIYCLFWRSSPSVVIGKNQNLFEEANVDYANKENINLCRRISGGGAVFHDEKNINYTIIVDGLNENFNQFKKHMIPLVEFIQKFGVEVSMTERNDLRYNNMKISGTAQYSRGDRVLHHGTFLYDSDRMHLSNSLKCNKFSYKSNSVKSVRSEITNMKEHLKSNLSAEDMMGKMARYFSDYYQGNLIELTEDILLKATRLMEEKYKTWDWIYGFGPKFQARYHKQTDFGIYDVDISVKDGYIVDAIASLNGKEIDTGMIIDKAYTENYIIEKILLL